MSIKGIVVLPDIRDAFLFISPHAHGAIHGIPLRKHHYRAWRDHKVLRAAAVDPSHGAVQAYRDAYRF